MQPSAPRWALSCRANSRRQPSALVMRSPTYSMTRVPLGIALEANMPRPWIFDPRTLAQGVRVFSGLGAFFFAVVCCFFVMASEQRNTPRARTKASSNKSPAAGATARIPAGP
jgi:hypothetical protein